MKTSLVTTKGQVTIPASVRNQLGIHQGDRVGFVYENGKVIILPVIKDIEAAFGLVSASQSASLDDIEQAIQSRGGKL
ncbi:AbrB/MazE/SpoVT family DNA-binding domain-containing protein [Mariprofundus erugo]|uniref:AbrB/MazE/SpoVT family DNA-binding domain-containing protein n=1 Tax=Mariprofundus erugo TaxID=2528639 RepID=A0A5R9GJA9_9PROT|nr:AbrB/MazE/SpoVT family DNA-binding domain-containing protein [Mariprofundus erugo]TLS66726.1 AbrB/MazE/SpoVT family DNA-binding domain-containing protein [Mariprofundus erugo]